MICRFSKAAILLPPALHSKVYINHLNQNTPNPLLNSTIIDNIKASINPHTVFVKAGPVIWIRCCICVLLLPIFILYHSNCFHHLFKDIKDILNTFL